jgi:hypothetical protein
MKKVLSIVVAVAVFALVGCSAEKSTPSVSKGEYLVKEEKCASKKCHHRHHQGKLGDEKNYEDSAK